MDIRLLQKKEFGIFGILKVIKDYELSCSLNDKEREVGKVRKFID